MMGWTYLCIAGLFEVAWVVGVKYTAGFTRFWPSVVTLVTMGVSVWFLAQAVKTLPMGTAYAVWTGIGAVGTVVLGMILFGESRDALRLVCIALIVAGIVGLRLVSEAPPAATAAQAVEARSVQLRQVSEARPATTDEPRAGRTA